MALNYLESRNDAIEVNYNQTISFAGGHAEIAITSHGSDWYWAVTSVMMASSLAFLGLSFTKPRHQRAFHYITAMITMVASVAYFSMASNIGWAPTPVEFVRLDDSKVAGFSRQVFYVRYIDWAITTPLLLMDLLLTAGLPWGIILFTVMLDEIMVVTGLVGALVKSSYKWGYWTFGMIALFYIGFVLLFEARSNAYRIGRDVGKSFVIVGTWTFFLWMLYPVAWGVCEGGNLIAPDSEAVFYGILDIMAKPVFGALLLYGHRGIDPERLGMHIGSGNYFEDESGTRSKVDHENEESFLEKKMHSNSQQSRQVGGTGYSNSAGNGMSQNNNNRATETNKQYADRVRSGRSTGNTTRSATGYTSPAGAQYARNDGTGQVMHQTSNSQRRSGGPVYTGGQQINNAQMMNNAQMQQSDGYAGQATNLAVPEAAVQSRGNTDRASLDATLANAGYGAYNTSGQNGSRAVTYQTGSSGGYNTMSTSQGQTIDQSSSGSGLKSGVSKIISGVSNKISSGGSGAVSGEQSGEYSEETSGGYSTMRTVGGSSQMVQSGGQGFSESSGQDLSSAAGGFGLNDGAGGAEGSSYTTREVISSGGGVGEMSSSSYTSGGMSSGLQPGGNQTIRHEVNPDGTITYYTTYAYTTATGASPPQL